MRRARFTKHGMLAIARNAWGAEFSVTLEAPEPFEAVGSVAVVQVCGPITNHDEGWFDSYDAIKQRLGAALASPATSVVLEFDSPGGDCAGCYETSRQLRAMAKKAGKKLYAVSSGLMASAAYALACAADFIACPETSFCGSIGVIEMLVDQVQADRAFGLNFAVIASGDHKADGNPHTALDLSVLTEATARVKSLADGFFALVAESRPSLSSTDVEAFQARVFHGKAALDAGLADAVMTKDELLAMVAGSAEQQTGSTEAAEDSDMSWKNELKKAADDGDEDAKKALAALEDDDKKSEGEKKPDGDPPPPSDDDKKKADDADDSDEDEDTDTDSDEDKMAKKAAKSGKSAKASATTSTIVELARTVNKLHASVSAIERSKVDAERKAIFDARPDLAANANMKRKEHPILAIARKASSLDDVREMLNAIPVDKRNVAAAAQQATGTAGSTQAGGASRDLNSADEAHIDRMMGLSSSSHNKVRSTGSTLELGYLTPEQARARVAELDRDLNKKESV